MVGSPPTFPFRTSKGPEPQPPFFPFADAFAYPDGPLTGNGRWSDNPYDPTLTVDANTVVNTGAVNRNNLDVTPWILPSTRVKIRITFDLPAAPIGDSSLQLRAFDTDEALIGLIYHADGTFTVNDAFGGLVFTTPYTPGSALYVEVNYDPTLPEQTTTISGTVWLDSTGTYSANPSKILYLTVSGNPLDPIVVKTVTVSEL